MAAAIKDTVNSMLSALNLGGEKTGEDAPPQPPSDSEFNELKQKYEKAGQGHVFQYWEELKPAEQGAIYKQLEPIDPEHINKITETALNPPAETEEEKNPKLEQLPDSVTSSVIDSKDGDLNKWYDSGLKLISENQVGVVLMAGGQGTRLGSSAPKGCFDIGLPSKKSLFQLQAERIGKLENLASKTYNKEDVSVPWYIMTSGPTRKPTEQFFEENKYFGLNRNNVIFFEQGVLPCISNEGKILLENNGKVAVAPDGNGGLYQALISSGVVQDMSKRGIKHVHAYCVDNCLVRVADPTFIGFSAEKDVEIATKVVRKRNAAESVGLIMQKNGKPAVVEYSEIDNELAEAKDAKDSDLLKFRAANIVNHYYSTAYLSTIPDWAHELPHHVARKKIPTIDLTSGDAIKPSKPNGIKLEQFIFDNFPRLALEKFASLEVRREDEFSPLKNAPNTGEDDPQTSKRDIMLQGKRWAEAAGAIVSGDQDAGIEVSPLVSYAGEGLEHLAGKEIIAPAVLEME